MTTTEDSDVNPLRSLQASLEKAQKNTSKMVLKIQRIEDRLSAIENEMQPIQITTANYTTAKENIGATLTEVEKTHEYFRIAAEVDAIVNDGLELRNQAKRQSFFTAIGRLSEAKAFFKSHRKEIKSAGSALTSIDKLLTVIIL